MATSAKSAAISRGQFSTFLNTLLDSLSLNSQRIENVQSTWDVWPHIVATNIDKSATSEKLDALRCAGLGHIQIPENMRTWVLGSRMLKWFEANV